MGADIKAVLEATTGCTEFLNSNSTGAVFDMINRSSQSCYRRVNIEIHLDPDFSQMINSLFDDQDIINVT
ncbi:hypothetical protein EUTSA_v10029114mg [Eutrema salsugineum]|uniref:Uncharacterized protein n=1 Tax=Eutrema salsugineum TaxID=72664 RepID=V4L775_EUTSA|nr:hypothetical protein EUTSA_v10029114mg [Eutrema salsugineum]